MPSRSLKGILLRKRWMEPSPKRARRDPVIISDSEQETHVFPELTGCLKPYLNWNRMVDVVLQCNAVSKPGHNILWDLPDLGVSECDPDALTHVAHIINDGLSSRAVDSYKIGITFKPYDRFTKYTDYKYLQKMVVACVSENPDAIARLERSLKGS
jgi:hypothetical protein